MNQNRWSYFLFGCMLLVVARGVAADGLVASAYYLASPSRLERAVPGDQELRTFLLIKNVSNREITIPTARLGGMLSVFRDGTAVVEYRFSESRLKDGTVPVVPLAEFAPVALRPNESALLLRVINVPAGAGRTVMLRYEIGYDIAQRYGFLQCLLEATAINGSPYR
jgi:hypothetical protein